MNAFLVFVSRWMLAMFWVFGALQQSESAIVCQEKPDDPTIVVLGVNSSVVSLNWKTCEGNADETIRSFSFSRQRPDSPVTEQIASRDAKEGFTMIAPFKGEKKYKARLDQELRIINVQRDEEYIYTLEVDFKDRDGAVREENFRVTIDVKEPPRITDSPEREFELNPSSKKNYTLTCNASGDPHPNIIWTKAGVPASQFNASGYVLHLVDVKREDAGSYICTASNGFGEDATAISIVNVRCTDCKTKTVGITIDLTFKNAFTIPRSVEFEELESSVLSAIRAVYADDPEKELYQVDIKEFRDGSVFAIVELTFGSSVSDPLKPLRDEVNNGKLGSYTVVGELDLNPTATPSTESTETTTKDQKESPSTGARGSSSLSNSELWGIIGGCIAFVVVVAIIILVCCICRKRSKNSGASKGGKSYSEADGYRMNRQPPPSGLGTASPAYVEARQYAPVTAARRQDDQSKPPLNYADLSLNNSSGPGRKPPPYSGTEYSEMSPEKRPPPAGGQQGEGGGFELWC